MADSLQNKLDYLDETKQLIKQALIEKEQEVTDEDTFRSYADKIKDIETGIDGSTEDRFITLPARSIKNGKVSVDSDMFVTLRYNNSSGGLNGLDFKRFVFIRTSTNELPLYVDSSDNNIDYVSLYLHLDGTVETYTITANSAYKDKSAVFKKFNAMPDVAITLEDKNNLPVITTLTDTIFDVSTLNLSNENGWICSGLMLLSDTDPETGSRLYTNPDVVPSATTIDKTIRNIFGKESAGLLRDYGEAGNFQLNSVSKFR